MQEPFAIRFLGGATALVLRVEETATPSAVLRKLGFQGSRPVIVLVGGASGLRHFHVARLNALFVNILAPLAEALGAVVVDGGTDAGVMEMMGRARNKTRSTFPLLGVAPVGLATLPGDLTPVPDSAPLEPNHTHFALIPGSQWGDESLWIAQIASALAEGAPSVTVLINGGEITWKDAAASVQVGRPIVAIAGSGRAADTLVAALKGTITDNRAEAILASGLLYASALENLNHLQTVIQDLLPVGQPDSHITEGTASEEALTFVEQ
jgi:hypothetical protein